jgi:hypothetical protein
MDVAAVLGVREAGGFVLLGPFVEISHLQHMATDFFFLNANPPVERCQSPRNSQGFFRER